MTAGKPYPADERALQALYAKATEIAMSLAPGRRAEIVIERRRGGRITGRIIETHYPLDDGDEKSCLTRNGDP